MAYNGNWINELDDTQPPGTETKSFGDDALREIKRSLSNTFPGAATGEAYTGSINDLNTAILPGGTFPRDTVIMWYGLEANVPAGWDICDGRARTSGGGNTPDLRNKFVLGAKSDTDVSGGQAQTPLFGNTGGTHETNIRSNFGAGAAVTFTASNVALTVAQLPNISANLQLALDASGQSDNHSQTATVARGRDSSPNVWTTTPVRIQGAAGNAHNHTLTIQTTNTDSNKPAYMGLLFLIKD